MGGDRTDYVTVTVRRKGATHRRQGVCANKRQQALGTDRFRA
jgi:hypothetical protein